MAVNINGIPDRHEPDRTGSIRDALSNYPELYCILNEFIQNAEDAKSRKLTFNITPTQMIIKNDGDAFDDDDFARLIDFAKGKFGQVDKIGKFGIGFLSTFHVTDSPEVVSNGAHIKIQPDGSVNKTWHPASANEKGAEFLLPFRFSLTKFAREINVLGVNETNLSDIAQAYPNTFNNGLLFLENLELIEGWRQINDSAILLCKADRKTLETRYFVSNHLKVEHKQVQISLKNTYAIGDTIETVVQKTNWHVFSKDFKRQYIDTFHCKPQNRTKVSLAFCLNSSGYEKLGQLYAYLPTRVATGLNFNLNADFAPRTGRDDIRDERGTIEGDWNNWLITCLATLAGAIGEKLTSLVNKPTQFYDLVPTSYSEEREYLGEIQKGFLDGTADKKIIYNNQKTWVSKQDGIKRANSDIRKILKNSRVNLVHPQIEKNPKGEFLLNHLQVSQYNVDDLLDYLLILNCNISLDKAPTHVNNLYKISRIYSFLSQNISTPLQKQKLRNTHLCPSQNNILHAFDNENSRIYWADNTMRKLISGEDIPIINEQLWKTHSKFIREYISNFDAENLIDYLDSNKSKCINVFYKKCPIKLLSSMKSIGMLWRYLIKSNLFEESRWAKLEQAPLDGTPVFINEEGKICALDINNPEIYYTDTRTRKVLRGSYAGFINSKFKKETYQSFFKKAGVSFFGPADVINFLKENIREGDKLESSNVVINTEEKLISLTKYLSASKLDQEVVTELASTPVFLTSQNIFRPLRGGEQGTLFLQKGNIKDPLKLDCALNNNIYHGFQSWLKNKLKVAQHDFTFYVKEHLLPNYEGCNDKTKYSLLLMLQSNYRQLEKDPSLVELLKQSNLIRSDKSYYPASRLCYQSKNIKKAFDFNYSSPHDCYNAKSRSIISKRWKPFFNWLGVRNVPHPDDILSWAEHISNKNARKSGRQLLKFLNDYQSSYIEDTGYFETLKQITWVPEISDHTELYSPLRLYIPELRELSHSQHNFVDFKGLSIEIVRLLSINTELTTLDIVKHLLWLSSEFKPAPVAIYRELESRANDDAISLLKDERCIHTNAGEFWPPYYVFFEPVDPVLHDYLRQVPNDISHHVRFLQAVGVKPRPSSENYFNALLEIAEEYTNISLDPATIKALVAIYKELTYRLDKTIIDKLKTASIVLGSDGFLHKPGDIFIDDTTDKDFGFTDKPIFAFPPECELFFLRIGICRFSTAVSLEPVSFENPRLDESLTDKMRRVWSNGILRLQLTARKDVYDIASLENILRNLQIFNCQDIRGQYTYSTSIKQYKGIIVQVGALWDIDADLYFVDSDPDTFLCNIAEEFAKNLVPDNDFRMLSASYEEIIRCQNQQDIDILCKKRGYRNLFQNEVFALPSQPESKLEHEPIPQPEQRRDSDAIAKPQGDMSQSLAESPKAERHYWDTSILIPISDKMSTPEEAKPSMPGHYIGPNTSTRRTPSNDDGSNEEDLETERNAIELVCSYEELNGWETDSNEGKGYIGYDIEATKDGKTKFIEVKSSKHQSIYNLSWKQFEKARLERERYYLYRVWNLEKSDDSVNFPIIIIIQDPWGYIEIEWTSFKIKSVHDSNTKGSIRRIDFGLNTSTSETKT